MGYSSPTRSSSSPTKSTLTLLFSLAPSDVVLQPGVVQGNLEGPGLDVHYRCSMGTRRTIPTLRISLLQPFRVYQPLHNLRMR